MLKRRTGVLYVELCTDSDTGYLRLESAAAATACLTAAADLRDAQLLTGGGSVVHLRGRGGG